MSKLYRPYIPLAVRVQVAERQMRELNLTYRLFGNEGPVLLGRREWKNGYRLKFALSLLFGDKPFALDHNPALMNRKRRGTGKNTVYSPPANDPDYLIYREAGPGSDHDIKTRVRGDGAQHSDQALARIRKRRERKHSGAHKSKIKSANRWPAKGTRKIQSRGFR